MALNTALITATVAALAVPAVGSTKNIAFTDISNVDLHINQRDCPIVIPAPGEWKGGSSGSPDTETTFGAPGARMWLVHQNFKFIFVQAMVGAGRDVNDHYLKASQNADAIWTALTALNIAGVDVQAVNIQPIGVISDPMGEKMIGCFFDVTFRERINP
jgi:hypothetical protein